MCLMEMSAEDDYSCVSVEKKLLHMPLSLAYVSNPAAGVREIIESWINHYVPCLEGVLLSYKNISFKARLGKMIIDQAFVHYDVEAEFSLFKPYVGAILQGTVNRISREHVGCVVHGCINALVHHVTNLASDISSLIANGNVVLFKVTSAEVLKKMVRVHGEITRDCCRLMRADLRNGDDLEVNEGSTESTGESENPVDQEENLADESEESDSENGLNGSILDHKGVDSSKRKAVLNVTIKVEKDDSCGETQKNKSSSSTKVHKHKKKAKQKDKDKSATKVKKHKKKTKEIGETSIAKGKKHKKKTEVGETFIAKVKKEKNGTEQKDEDISFATVKKHKKKTEEKVGETSIVKVKKEKNGTEQTDEDISSAKVKKHKKSLNKDNESLSKLHKHKKRKTE